MKGVMTVSQWKMAQFFLSKEGVFEVETDGEHFRCTCPRFSRTSSCKHTNFVQGKAKENDGVYPLQVSARATTAEERRAQRSAEHMRKFLVKYGKVEVL